MQDLTSEAVQDFTSIEQLFGDDQPQLANPEKEPLWSSVTSKFKGLTRKFKVSSGSKSSTSSSKGPSRFDSPESKKMATHPQKKIRHLKTWQKVLLIILLIGLLLLSVLASIAIFVYEKC